MDKMACSVHRYNYYLRVELVQWPTAFDFRVFSSLSDRAVSLASIQFFAVLVAIRCIGWTASRRVSKLVSPLASTTSLCFPLATPLCRAIAATPEVA
jgi:hypothetical protein